ncbi:MAG TPA: tRNA (N(6)-L-threonylcarbamoyladenosine(37)-C(2))-methylthiotransferase MtaB [Chitinophagales bacterium]|nr:tRNA (N(6)-L-threonylcarbamoyladenosine(37)-C(2))-methylthiotransferase MtaB [Chitinophagales bacterium]
MFSGKRIAFHTLGCKLNFSESSAIFRVLEKDGFSKVRLEEAPDVVVINTCSVTENADKECRQIVRKALKHSPDAQVVVIGCYAQLKPEEIASIEGVDLVLGAKEKFRLADYLKVLPAKKQVTEKAVVYSCDVNEVNLFESSYSLGERTRAFLKVQDGCDYSCTYCTIPLARGKSRSDTIAHAVDQANLLADLGVKEIVLTGVNIGDFGNHHTQTGERQETFFGLMRELESKTSIERFRISSIEPNLLKDEIIEWVAQSKRFVPHFHIPLQSGSDTILKRMKRRYLSDVYTSRVEKINSLMPHCCIGVDVITGFPGETQKEFLETYNFLNEADISYLHVFTYSERDHTEAINMEGVVPIHTRHERTKMLRILSEKKRHLFYQQQLGTVRNVLFENPSTPDVQEGFTDNYIKVVLRQTDLLAGEIVPVILKELNGQAVMGEIANSYAVLSQKVKSPGYDIILQNSF